MPRTARLDAPGVLHHVMIRRIECRKTFRNNKDRKDFIDSLEVGGKGPGRFSGPPFNGAIEADQEALEKDCEKVRRLLTVFNPANKQKSFGQDKQGACKRRINTQLSLNTHCEASRVLM